MNRLLCLLAALLLFTGCSPHRHHHHRATKPAKVHHLADGRYAYQDNSGLWWFYLYHLNDTGSSSVVYTSSTRSYAYYVNPSAVSSPLGGAWISAKALNIPEEQLELALNDPRAVVIEEPVEIAPNGEPMDVQTEEQMELDFGEMDANGTDTGESDAGDSDSDGGGDSGGGDSGDSGGGDGGGGGDSSSPSDF